MPALLHAVDASLVQRTRGYATVRAPGRCVAGARESRGFFDRACVVRLAAALGFHDSDQQRASKRVGGRRIRFVTGTLRDYRGLGLVRLRTKNACRIRVLQLRQGDQ